MPFDSLPADPIAPRPRDGAHGHAVLARARGTAAESAALRRYVKGGAKPLARNWRAPRRYGNGEIDLILERDGAVIFVEVKARRTLEEAAHAIRPAQLRRIGRAAEAYMQMENRTGDEMFIDLVLCDRFGTLEKVANVWID